MMKKDSNKAKPTRNKVSPQFKDQALDRAPKEGIRQTTKDLNIAEAMPYSWRAKKTQGGNSLENQKWPVQSFQC
jgi:transposase